MKCKSMILIEARRKKGSGELYQKVTYGISPAAIELHGVKPPEGAQVCGGEVKVLIDIEHNGGCSCSGGYISISYRCLRCGSCSFPELPTDVDDFSKLASSLLSKMPENDYDAMLLEHVNRQRARADEIRKFHEEKDKRRRT